MSYSSIVDSICAERIIVDDHKTISVLEFNAIIPFEVNRIYWINFDADTESSSAHAHKSLDQIIFCLNGSVEIEIEGNSTNLKTTLTNDGTGILVPHMHWKRISYHEKSTILCLASQPFDEDDYIREYADFLKWKVQSV